MHLKPFKSRLASFIIVNQPKISKCHHERWKNSWKCKVQILLQFNEFFQVYFSPIHPVILKIPFWHILKILYRILSKSIYTKQRGQSWRRKDLFFLSSSVIVCQRRCTVFENPPKSRIQHCERSELRLHFE